MRSTFLVGMALALALALAVVAGQSPRDAHADPFSYDYDVSITPLVGATLDAGVPVTLGTYVQLRTDPGTADGEESFFDRASAFWDAIHIAIADDHPCVLGGYPAPCPPAANFAGEMANGDFVGSNDFSIRSNLVGLPPNPYDIGARLGQPGVCPTPAGDTLDPVVATFDIQSGAVNSAFSGTVSSSDTNMSGLPDDQDPGAVHARGVEEVPDWVDIFNASLGLTPAFFSRGFGIAPIVPGVAQTSVNFMTYQLGDISGNGSQDFLSFTTLGVPAGIFPAVPTSAQAVQTCTYFESTTTVLGVSVGATPNRVIGTPSGGTQTYRLHLSSADDYDGDGVPAFNDNCKAHANSGQEVTRLGAAPSNGIGDACDDSAEWTAIGAPAVSGAVTDSGLTIEGNADLSCLGVQADPSMPWDGLSNTDATFGGPPFAPCQDADRDGFINLSDNCPLHANTDQTNTSGDGVGNACDPNPNLKGPNTAGWGAVNSVWVGDSVGGNLAGGSAALTPGAEYHDHDDILVQAWTEGDGPVAGAYDTGLSILAGRWSVLEDGAFPPGNPGGVLGTRDTCDTGTPDLIDSTTGVPGCLNFANQGVGTASRASVTGAGGDPLAVARPYACPLVPAGVGAKARSDVGRSGFVVATDLSAVISNLDAGAPFPSKAVANSDVNCDGFVTATDLSTVIGNLD